MPRLSKFVWLFLLVAPVALAQPVGGEAPATAPAAGPTPTEPMKMTMSGPAMLDQGREYRKEIEANKLQVQTQIQQAKNDKDVIRLNCLLDKLTQLNVNANILDQSLQNLQETVTRRDETAQLHEYTRITIVNQKVQVLKTEADACIGAETSYVGPTKVMVEKPPGLVDTVDQPEPPAFPVTLIDRPSPASKFQ